MAESPSKSDAAATVSTTKVAQAVDGDQAAPVNTAKLAEALAKPAKACSPNMSAPTQATRLTSPPTRAAATA